MDKIKVRVTQLLHGVDLPLPDYATPASAGMDLIAAVENAVVVQPGERVLVPTGLQVALPEGFEIQVRPRSGLALKHGLTVLNTPGTIDADYRGEIMVILINLGTTSFKVERGMRIAQMVVTPVVQGTWEPVQVLGEKETERSTKGFGSTGVF